MKPILFLVALAAFSYSYAQDTLTVMAYNILNYPGSNATKADTLKPIIKHVQPDIFMITELSSASGVTSIINDALNVDGVTYYQSATYFNGPSSDNMLFYNSDKLVLYSQYEIPTVLRNISEYVLYYKDPGLTAQSDTVFIYCYMAHLKASSGLSNEQQRDQEATALKSYMNTRNNIENVILGGDFNLYSSSEPAYNTLLNTGNVKLLDPISSPGSWSNNVSFANIHTQSTRSSSIGDGGAFGGMDDRFDFILFNNDLLTGTNGMEYLPNSYTAIGNDGNHFNKAITATPTNTSAPLNIINALYIMSDHLPVVMKARVGNGVGILDEIKLQSWKGYFSDQTFYFISSRMEEKVQVEVFDVLGKQVIATKQFNKKDFKVSLNNLRRGVYFVKVRSGKKQRVFKGFSR